MRQALVFYGGWSGHEPDQVAEFMAELCLECSIKPTVVEGTEALAREPSCYDLLIPVLTMATIDRAELAAVIDAVRIHGSGLAGCHGGMCDAFRSETEWHFMTGGQWVAHPGDDGVSYRIEIQSEHELGYGLEDFDVVSEQYYLHVDPGVRVLANTEFPLLGVPGPHEHNPCRMPQAWTKDYGFGKVFYFALGHSRSVLEAAMPREIMRRGIEWACR